MTQHHEPTYAFTTPDGVQQSPRHDGRRVVPQSLLWVAVVATFLTALAVGWFFVSFQLFGVSADRGDYQSACGTYAVGAALLALTPFCAGSLRLPFGSSYAAAAGAAVLVLLALHSGDQATAFAPDPTAETWAWGGMFLAMVPWMWALPVLLLVGLCSSDAARR